MIAACADWAQAAGVIGVAWALAAGYAAWRFTGGRHEHELRRERRSGS